VCIKFPVTTDIPEPHPAKLKDVWDGYHVRMPWSKDNLYPVDDPNTKGKKILRCRWDLIVEALSVNKISTSFDLEESILTYNSRYRGKSDWDFSALHTLFTDEFDDEESKAFFTETLPRMVDILVVSPTMITCPLPLLSAGSSHSITLSQQQILTILVNAFFCTFPRRNAKAPGSEFYSYPGINFNTLFGNCPRRPVAHLEKLKCLLCYFSIAVKSCSNGLVTFKRKVVRDVPEWHNSIKSFNLLHLTSKGTIEVDGKGMLQADFANKFVGGGVLRSGLVQEEIRFTVCPELMASMLFTEVLGDREVLLVVGAEQFSNYSGYSDTFQFTGRYKDSVVRDSSGRKETSIVAMDAIRFVHNKDQYSVRNIDRELNKAFVAFQNKHVDRLQAVATGNWGCGAFGGDPRLKLVIQIMAAAEAGRDMVYYTFGDDELVVDGGQMYQFLVDKKVTVGTMYKLLCSFVKSGTEMTGSELFSWIYQHAENSHKENVVFKDDTSLYEAETDNEENDFKDEYRQSSPLEFDHMKEKECDVTDSDKLLMEQVETIESKSKALKVNGGLLAALDKMEKGELIDVGNKLSRCPVEEELGLVPKEVNGKEVLNFPSSSGKGQKRISASSSNSLQSKMTDFFSS